MIESKLSEILGRKRIKMSELALKTGTTKNTVLNLYHNRTKRIEFDVLNKICNVLECTPNDILRHTPDLEKRHISDERFGAPIPSVNEALKIGDDEFIDVDGNKFDGSAI